jgi:hypothetical protein
MGDGHTIQAPILPFFSADGFRRPGSDWLGRFDPVSFIGSLFQEFKLIPALSLNRFRFDYLTMPAWSIYLPKK